MLQVVAHEPQWGGGGFHWVPANVEDSEPPTPASPLRSCVALTGTLLVADSQPVTL